MCPVMEPFLWSTHTPYTIWEGQVLHNTCITFFRTNVRQASSYDSQAPQRSSHCLQIQFACVLCPTWVQTRLHWSKVASAFFKLNSLKYVQLADHDWTHNLDLGAHDTIKLMELLFLLCHAHHPHSDTLRVQGSLECNAWALQS